MMLAWPWTSTAALAATFVPTALQIEGLAAMLASGLVMLLLGRAVLGSRALPEIAVVAGWGVVALVLTAWGVTTQDSMRIPAAALVVAAAIAAFLPRGRLAGPELIGVGRLLLLGLPLLAVFAAAWPSEPDTFTNQLANAAYLYDYGQFPGIGRPPMLAVWPALPYNLQLAAFLPALLVHAYPPNILTHANLLLQLAFALLLSRSLRGTQAAGVAAPSWPAIGGALLLTTFLNPGFSPSIQFTGYSDPAIAVAVAFAAWGAERLLAALAQERSAAEERLALVFILLGGAAIKQVSIFLMASVVAVAFLMGAFDQRIGPRRALPSFAAALLPALLLVGIWRFYVGTHFMPDDELRLVPVSEWNFRVIPTILASAAFQVEQRLPFFVLLYGVSLSAIPLALRRGLTPAVRLFLLTLGVTLLYTLFLVFTYVAHFAGDIGASAHSFFRYNTHLELLAMLAIVAWARETWVRRGSPPLGAGWSVVGIAGIVLALVAPIATAGWIREDRRMPQPLVWDLGKFVAPYLDDGAHVALLLPGDNRSVAYMLRAAIALGPPHHALANFDDFSKADAATLKAASHKEDSIALISCVPTALAQSSEGHMLKLVAGEAALLAKNGDGWRLVATHAYPAIPAPEGWTAQLSPGPFCR
jgi:hypothetical protein